VRFNFIEIAIGIEIELLKSDFDSEPDSDFDNLKVRAVMLSNEFRFDLTLEEYTKIQQLTQFTLLTNYTLFSLTSRAKNSNDRL